MRIRVQGKYKSVFTNSYKTIRLTSDAPYTPELEDVAITSKCNAGCPYCYVSALKSGKNFNNIIRKAQQIWGDIPINDRPFQIAIGGAGEPTLHPHFIPFLKHIRNLDIIPNYTTNGMHLTKEILEATEQYCGGVALSWHPHINNTFHEAIAKLSTINTKLNVHIIIGTEQSYQDLLFLYNTYKDIVDYFVLLPYQEKGRAVKIDVKDVFDKTFEWISNQEGKIQRKFAFGAPFYDYIKTSKTVLDMSLYDPDKYSGYRILNENYKTIYKSSYEQIEKSIIRNPSK